MGKAAFVLTWSVLWLALSPLAEAVWRPPDDLQVQFRATSLARIPIGQVIAGFQVIAAYTNQDENIVGLRLTHLPTAMPIHLFQMETVPQAAIMIRTALQSDDGAAHALEHLLLGKGTTGRTLQLLADMRLGHVTAGTGERFTWYHLDSGSGMASFLELLAHLLAALFHPDFTDEEVRHEVYHVGVSRNAHTDQRALIEQGTVYTEMASHEGQDDAWYALLKLVLGARHPLSFRAGGTPEGLRQLTVQAVRAFHRAHYVPGPTTPLMLVVDRQQSPAVLLTRLSQLLGALVPTGTGTESAAIVALHRNTHPAAPAAVQLVPKPSAHTTDPATVLFGWAPAHLPSLEDRLLVEALLHSLGQGSASLLYQSLVNRQSRELETGATGVGSLLLPTDDVEFPVSVLWIEGIRGDTMTLATLETIRRHIQAKLREVAGYPDAAPALQALNRRVRADLRARQRALMVWQASPPGFGQRWLEPVWMEHLERLEGTPGVRKSLVLKAHWPKIMATIESEHNPWRGVIQRAGLLEAPYVTAAIPTPAMQQQLAQAQQDRLAAAFAGLQRTYHAANDQEALRRLETDDAVQNQRLATLAQPIAWPDFTSRPPLTFDDTLQYGERQLAGVPLIASYVEGTARADVGLAFDLRGVPPRLYRYLPLLPGLIRSIGLREGPVVTAHDNVDERVARKFYGLDVAYRTNPAADRYELVITASGVGTAEYRAALEAVRQLTHHNDLHLDNLSRIKDLLEHYLTTEQAVSQQPEEDWIETLATAFRYQTDHLWLNLRAHPTRVHQLQRLRWLLTGPVPAATLRELRTFATTRLASLHTLSVEAIEQTLAHEQGTGLESRLVDYWRASLTELPPSYIGEGLQRLSDEVLSDLQVGNAQAIADMRELQATILNRARMRVWVVGDPAVLTKAHRQVATLIRSFPRRRLQTQPLEAQAIVIRQLQARQATAVTAGYPWYVGYVREQARTGNIVITAQGPDYRRRDAEALAEVLAGKWLAGTGPHTWYKKTWEAGLAYGNGLDVRPRDGTVLYYADRCPSIQGTLAFVRTLTRDLPHLTDHVPLDYAFAQLFGFSRAAQSFTARGEAMATDLAEGVTPAQVRRFSHALLRLRTDPQLRARVRQALPHVVAKVIPGPPDRMAKATAQSLFFFIAPLSQLQAVEDNLPGIPMYRIWPSDFWLE